ncbi:lymphocyte expansion molecule [Diorhabda carinulata]|uniref:lymphocyte expansion molecule n=1 Tax=Diorhabda carinulata TaxID=1163345 RepID=UPI0025A28924|nr:lymphocyte expansion molecule [Diorhabda carinulata]
MQKRKTITAVPHPPFLFATKKFATIGLHPSLDKSGSQRKPISHAGPGTYDPKFPSCSFKNGYLWKLKVESEHFSEYRGDRNPKLLEEAAFQKTLGGPGTNDVNESIYQRQHDSVFDNVGMGIGKRFVHITPDSPPMNTYFRKLSDFSTFKKKQMSDTATFEFDGFIDRFKSNVPPYLLPSNIYNITKYDGKNTADITKRVVSSRGPYELFTGPRDLTTIKNYFAPPSFHPPEYFYVKPSDLDFLLRHSSKSKTGKFLKGNRFTKKPYVRHMLNDLSLCYRNPKDPGPAYYNVESYGSITKKPPNLHAFNTSKPVARPPPANWTIFPGPGRYTPKSPKCMKQKRPSWVFLSKAERKIIQEIDYAAF